jgi:histidine triad (HIT) family protein
MQDSIFTKIIKGEIPCHKVYEDAYTFVFLDIHPIQPGHVLVVPKKQVGFVWDLAPDEYQHLMETVQKVGRHIREVMPEKNRVGVMIEGLDVADHAHVKVFPFSTPAEYRYTPDMTIEPDHAALALMAEKLRMEDSL